jgi:putative transcriptional regulator
MMIVIIHDKTVKWRFEVVLQNRLKVFRAILNVNQQEMGRLCGVSRQTISLIERGDYSPSVTLALTIAKVCGVTVEEIFYLQEEAENEKG